VSEWTETRSGYDGRLVRGSGAGGLIEVDVITAAYGIDVMNPFCGLRLASIPGPGVLIVFFLSGAISMSRRRLSCT